jgi:chromosome segregation ATPase
MIPALALGVLFGWNLSAYRASRRSKPDAAPAEDEPEKAAEEPDPFADWREARAEQDYLEQQLLSINESVATARQQLEELNQEHTTLLLTIDEKRASVQSTRTTLHGYEDDYRVSQNRILTDIDSSGEELDSLRKMRDNYTERINRLTQQVQRQDSELQMLRQAAKRKSVELSEGMALLEDRDNEFRRLTRQLQQREFDLERLNKQLNDYNRQLREMVEREYRYGSGPGAYQAGQVDVTTVYRSGPVASLPPGQPANSNGQGPEEVA